jgi:hypothetical protein
VCTLRIREGDPDSEGHLRRAFTTIFDVYGPGSYDVTISANAVLSSESGNARYSVFFGQSFGRAEYPMGRTTAVTTLADVASLRTDFELSDFEDVFFLNHPTSSVQVHSLISLVYIVTRPLANFTRRYQEMRRKAEASRKKRRQ